MTRTVPRLTGRAVSRRCEPLTVGHLAALEGPVRDCLTWELDPVRRARVAAGDALAEKQAWLTAVQREWGGCGRVLPDPARGGAPAAHVVWAPAAWVPGAGCFPTAPVSPDAVVVTSLWVHPDHRGGGLGRVLVQAMARDLLERGGVRAVETFGDASTRAGRQAHRGHRCVLPVAFWGAVGFTTVRPHPRRPRLRMDLSTTLTWRDEVEAALGRLADAVRPETAPSPAPRAEVTGTVDGARLR